MGSEDSHRNAIEGRVASGRGNGTFLTAGLADELERATGETLVAGTLNLILDRPVSLSEHTALTFDSSRFLWSGYVRNVPVWIYRWKQCPLHVVELLAPVNLRESLRIQDGDTLLLEVEGSPLQKPSSFRSLCWAIFWLGRKNWVYSNDPYYRRTRRLAVQLGASQDEKAISSLGAVRTLLRQLPIIGDTLSTLRQKLQDGDTSLSDSSPSFSRSEIDPDKGYQEQNRLQIANLVDYAKLSDSSYAASAYPGGYQTINLDGIRMPGQRDPVKRLQHVPTNFRGKTVLDMGCNQGGMLLALADDLKWGVGLDYDSRMINVANKLKALQDSSTLSFYVFDLELDPLDLIRDFLPDQHVDIVFLLSVCMWISNWKEVIGFASELSDSILFESNGSWEQQDAQEQELRVLYSKVELLAAASSDDSRNKRRRLYYGSNIIE